ncbi:hypothetical protein PSM7751_04215 [Pseudooceanicola marinus]|uniref:von Hippel-Lindau disease tumour suppressor beta domain-containing protein n=1 Tax=Pseudooceanicola marinus TaxID=396013 RepID=A0A1X7ABL6_9RHOB|nr:hypothetical protein [Pseudooceanicola marinus]PJE26303.1 hypothetical protein CVM50_20830 [Pseudooceanicola marinus]SLN74846.1 hypothetical protein PSM7751_04215 [Pseudooceanicola marinus]
MRPPLRFAAALLTGLASLAGPAGAQSAFPDITDAVPTQGREVLRYGEARGWTVGLGHSPAGAPIYCAATSGPDWSEMTIGYATSQWQLILPVTSRPDWEGTLTIDGQSTSVSGTAVDGWTIVWLAAWDVEALMQGSQLRVQMDNQVYARPLAGSAAAILKVDECAARNGLGGGMFSEAQAPAPTSRPGGVELSFGCPEPGTVRSVDGGTPFTATFRYAAQNRPMTIYWLDQAGQPVPIGPLGPNAPVLTVDTYGGHHFIAFADSDQTCPGVITALPDYAEIPVR